MSASSRLTGARAPAAALASALALVAALACTAGAPPPGRSASANANADDDANVNANANTNEGGPADACGLPGLTVSTPAGIASTRAAPRTPDWWWNGGVVYQILVRDYLDSDADGVGDLAGIAARIPYLADLGVDAVWLSPIYPSPTPLGYEVTSYTDVSPDLDPRWATGASAGATDLDALLAAAHAAGIRVLLDYVPNHSSSQHPWFVDAASSPTAAHRDWYVWSDVDLGWGYPWADGDARVWWPLGDAFYYAVFSPSAPDLNWRNPAVADALTRAAVGWVARGVDGFRLDAVRYLVEDGPRPLQADTPETHAALRAFTAAVRAARPDALLLGEAWTDVATVAPYLGSPESQAAGGDEVLPFDFDLADAICASDADAVRIQQVLDRVAALYPPGAGDAPFLSNHDQPRLADLAHGDRARLAADATLLLTLPGTPTLLYGEELGTLGFPGGTMAWDTSPSFGFTAGTSWASPPPGAATLNVATESSDPASLLARYRALLRLRRSSPALRHGDLARLDTTGTVLAYLRSSAAETILVATNLGPGAVRQRLALPQAAATALLADACAALERDPAEGWWVTLGPRASGVWRLE